MTSPKNGKSKITAFQGDMIEIAVEKSTSNELTVGKFRPSKVTTNEYAILKGAVLESRLFEAEICERAVLVAWGVDRRSVMPLGSERLVSA